MNERTLRRETVHAGGAVQNDSVQIGGVVRTILAAPVFVVTGIALMVLAVASELFSSKPE